ncbi:hypothetical protein K3722_10550 [Leisingera caerulea]|uniref:Uncharacterized protein n=1 Tax=Leisingera caerulea TaxID=506591 RepID=A0ABY5X2D6_LEICA|nr:hypothetical protein [Leisingera caerulea]UWQ60573.1 hypothetical protein K3722_10550 [Leisingera caerulea]
MDGLDFALSSHVGTPFVFDKRLLDAGTAGIQRKHKMQFHIAFSLIFNFNFAVLFFVNFNLIQLIHRIFTALFTRLFLQNKYNQPEGYFSQTQNRMIRRRLGDSRHRCRACPPALIQR